MTQPHGTDSKQLTPVPIAGRDQADTPVRLRVEIPSKPPPPPVADRYEVLRLVVDQGLPLSLAGDKLGVRSQVVGRIVQGALRRGEIEHTGRGKYERVDREEKPGPEPVPAPAAETPQDPEEKKRRFLALLCDEGIGLHESAEAAGVPRDSVYWKIKQAIKQGLIAKAGRGRYEWSKPTEVAGEMQSVVADAVADAAGVVWVKPTSKSEPVDVAADPVDPYSGWASYKSQQGRRGEEVLRIGKGIEISVSATRRYLAPLGEEVGVDVRADGGRLALLFGAPKAGMLGAKTHKTMRVGGPALVRWLEERGVARGRYRIEWDEQRRAMVAGEKIG